MANSQRTKAINELNKFIWTLQGKCDSISEINRNMILEYCRFSVLANEMSAKLQKDIDTMPDEDVDIYIKRYEKFNKIVLNLYKTLKFEQIKDELADFGNPYTKLFLEAENDGDF